jgi:DNA repair exonuclease SbcCD ATPase subunit
MLRFASLCALVALAAASDVTPIEKVVSLIEDMKAEVEKDGKTEGQAYNQFACFCKTQTDMKSKSVKRETGKIGRESADIADKTQEKKDDSTELAKRKQKHEDLNTKLDESKSRCAKQKAQYEAEEADMSHAIQGLKDAIKAMSDSKPSLLMIKKTLGKTFQLAEAMSLISTPKHKAVAALIQASVDPNDPEYNFHSNDIISVCNDLLVEYKASKKDLDDEWAKTKKGCEETQASLKKKLGANTDAMNQLDKDIARLEKEIAQHRENLVTADGILQDDELYLKDLTARCEDRANDYDQRSAMRNGELDALAGALKVLKGTVKAATSANKRALLQKSSGAATAARPTAKLVVAELSKAAAETLKDISFLQTFASTDLSQEAKKDRALEVLRSEGQRMGSVALTTLADRAAGDPFKKIKGLIQKLIERLLTESKNEATKKGFCDTELAKARKERDFRFQDANDLSADLAGLEAKKDALNEEIKELTKDIKDESKALQDATDERDTEKKANMKTLATAKVGLDGVNEALLILRSFYKQAAKAASFLQKASPVDEDTAGAGFSGNYKGSQDSMKAVFALLETIASDFDRTLRKTEAAEAEAHRDYVGLSQAAEASIAGKTTKKKLDEEDLATTEANLKLTYDGLQTAMDLLDAALKELEELKPTCIDTGMSYSERVAKREEEMKALGKALCILDEDRVEAECQKR